MINQTRKNYQKSVPESAVKLPLVEQMAAVGRKFKQFSITNLQPWQWFLLLYVAGTGSLLVLATFLKVAMKLI